MKIEYKEVQVMADKGKKAVRAAFYCRIGNPKDLEEPCGSAEAAYEETAPGWKGVLPHGENKKDRTCFAAAEAEGKSGRLCPRFKGH